MNSLESCNTPLEGGCWSSNTFLEGGVLQLSNTHPQGGVAQLEHPPGGGCSKKNRALRDLFNCINLHPPTFCYNPPFLKSYKTPCFKDTQVERDGCSTLYSVGF